MSSAELPPVTFSPEVGGDAEDHYQHGVVDVEAIGNKRENAH